MNENHAEDMERANLEKEAQRLQLEEARDKLISDFTIAAEDAAAVNSAEKDGLFGDIDALQKERDEVSVDLILCDADKGGYFAFLFQPVLITEWVHCIAVMSLVDKTH